MNLYLSPTPVLDSDHPVVAEFVREAVGDAVTLEEKARRIFVRVRDQVVYDPYSPFYRPEHYRASNVLSRGRGYCVSKAVVLCAAARAVGVPGRLGFATIRNAKAPETIREMLGCDLFVWHGYAELLLSGQWVKATPAFDWPVCERLNMALPEFDGKTDCVLPSTDLAGQPLVEYLEYHGTYADLPLERLLAGWGKVYGEGRVRFWQEAMEAAGDQPLSPEG